MKTTCFGLSSFMITIITLVVVLELCMTDNRQLILEENLSDAMIASMKMAMDDRGYAINTNEELVTDVIEYLSLFVTNDCSIDIEVIKSDISAGILSLRVTEYYTTTFGATNSITVTRTVIVDDYKVDIPDSYTIRYVIPDASGTEVLYKSYTLQEGDSVIYPSTENFNIAIKGWSFTIGGQILTPEYIKSLELNQDYVFYAILE